VGVSLARASQPVVIGRVNADRIEYERADGRPHAAKRAAGMITENGEKADASAQKRGEDNKWRT
jgi:hypothetical protein